MIGIPAARRRISSSVFKESIEYLQSQHVSPSVSNGKMATEVVDQFQMAQLLRLSGEKELNQLLGQKESNRFPIPRLSQLNNLHWSLALGPQLARQLAKEYRVLTEILPYETEALVNLSLRFGPGYVRFGNFLTPDKTIAEPTVSFEPRNKDRYHSLLLFDADYPDEANSRLSQYALWSRVNIKSEKAIELTPSTGIGVEAAPYVPPHPQRGSGTHRIIAALIEHEAEAEPGNFNRQFDLIELTRSLQGQIIGFAFFRTCWTKTVSQIYSETLGQPEPLYGDLKDPIPIRPYKYTNA